MPAPGPATSEASTGYSERYEELTGSSLWERPVCHQGRMLVIEILPVKPAPASNADQGYLMMQRLLWDPDPAVPHRLGPTK
jgi:hypothetical protein